MFLDDFIDAIELHTPSSKEEATARFLRAAEEAVSDFFGDNRRYEASLTRPYGQIEVLVMFDVVETVDNPEREVALEACLPLFDDVQLDDELGFVIGITYVERQRAEQVEQTHAPLSLGPLQHIDLERALERSLSNVFYEAMDSRPTNPEGSVGALLEQGGGWLSGLSGTSESGQTNLTIKSAFFDPKASSTSSSWVDYGLVLDLEESSDTREVRFAGSDHFGNVSNGFALEADQNAEDEVRAQLGDLAQRYEESTSTVNTYRFESLILAAAQKQPEDGCLFHWMRDVLAEHFKAQGALQESFQGYTLTLELSETYMSEQSFARTKHGSISGFMTWRDRDGNVLDVREQSVPLGTYTQAAFSLPAPDKDAAATLLDWTARAHTFIGFELRELLAGRGDEPEGCYPNIFGWYPENCLDALMLTQKAISHGMPPAPPVPFPTKEQFESTPVTAPTQADLARVEQEFRGCTARPFATYRVQDYLIVLRDDTSRHPFGCSEITLLQDDQDESTQILLTDVWNPSTRWSIDGDAFAFRRFMQWLEGQIKHHDLDHTIEFHTDPDPDEEYYEDEEEVAREEHLLVSEWLHQGLHERGDEFLLDWRFQHYIVGSGYPMTNAAGMFGFRAAYVKQLAERDRKRWRTFLAQCVHPAFGEGGYDQ